MSILHVLKVDDPAQGLKNLSACSVNGEEVLCIKSELWLTKNGERDGKFFYRLLQPSPP